jgi:hypothetical protein
MSNIELKEKIFGKINQISDNGLLSEVSRILEISSTDSEIFITSLNHKAAINEAIVQIEDNNFLTEIQANSEIERWLSK